MKTFGVVMFWLLVIAVPVTFVGIAIQQGVQETERVGYCKAIDAKFVNSDPDFCLKGNSVVHFF